MKTDLKIYNSFSKQKTIFQSRVPGTITLYVCGITVYDYCHLGHARVFVVFDMVCRVLRSIGWQVKYVRNITDIDDKIIQRAREKNQHIDEFTEKFIEAMNEDMQALGVLAPDEAPRATAYIPQMLAMIEKLVDTGFAYQAENGDVYFCVDKFETYGQLAHQNLADLRAGARVGVGGGVESDSKHQSLDFVLWKQAKPDEPAWASKWGAGRPGWHIECSAMATHCLGPSIDIHGGGFDLKFPHHENERAQSEACTHQKFVNTWMHVGFVKNAEEKMSKSLNNFLTIRDLLQKYDGEVIRYFLLSTHYRSPLQYSENLLEAAKQRLSSLYLSLRVTDREVDLDSDIDSDIDSESERNINNTIETANIDFIQALNDDFNTPAALAVLDEYSKALNTAKLEKENINIEKANINIKKLSLILKKSANSLGLLERDPNDFLQAPIGDGLGSHAIEQLIIERKQARENKDWARADALRVVLDEQGIVIEDSVVGSTWRRK